MTTEESGENFYRDAEKYWKDVPATVDGMLGGFSHISSTDIAGSTKFLHHYIRGPSATTGHHRALDCGAGIGRITKRLLLHNFDTVDMVELNPDFLEKAKSYLGDGASKVERYIPIGLQDFIPDVGRYDVIWSQWVLGHLTDSDLEAFFRRCKTGLAENGIIVVKENMASSKGGKEFDQTDSSYTRTKTELLDIIEKAGLKVITDEKQKNFPKKIYDVCMLALR